jgi:hypothetical protein
VTRADGDRHILVPVAVVVRYDRGSDHARDRPAGVSSPADRFGAAK